jgi:hypothetical protein
MPLGLVACGCPWKRGARWPVTPRGFTSCCACLGLRWSAWPVSTAPGRREYLTALATGLARLVNR